MHQNQPKIIQKALGIDLGGYKSVISIAEQTKVEVLVNDGSQRETQNIVGFKNDQRFLGEQAALQFRTNFSNSINYLNRFIGLHLHPEYVEKERKHLSCNLKKLLQKFWFEVQYDGETKYFKPEQLVGAYISYLIQNRPDPVVISYPDYFTEQEKFCILEACDIGQIYSLGMLSESEAVMHDYGFNRREEIENRTVAFIDIGQCKSNAFICTFTKNNAYKIAHVFERHLGGRDMDEIALNILWNTFASQLGKLNDQQYRKARMRLLGGVEKLRITLSLDTEGQINIDNITSEYDFFENISRKKYEEMISPVLRQIKDLLLKLKQQYNGVIHSIEIIGGLTRMPSVQQVIQSVFGINLSRTLHATETVSKGCALYGNLIQEGIKYNVDNYSQYTICVGWLINNNMKKYYQIDKHDGEISALYPKNQCFELFKQLESTKTMKSLEVAVSRFNFIELTVFYEPKPEGSKRAIKQYTIYTPQGHHRFDSLKIVMGYDYFLSLNIIQISVQYMGNVVIQNLPFDVNYFYEDSQQQIQQYQTQELEMKRKDQEIIDLQDARNDLESLIYKTREHLNSMNYISPHEKQQMLNDLLKIENWLYDEQSQKSIDDYQKQKEDILKQFEPFQRLQYRHMYK